MNKRFAARLTLACVVVCLIAVLAAGARASRVASPARVAPHPGVAAAPAPVAPAAAAQTFNLADFGAVGNGVTDDGPALQAALDAVVAAGGGTLNVPAGRFAIVTPVSVIVPAGSPTPAVEIRGVGPGTPIAGPFDGGAALTRGLGLVSEFAPRTGTAAVAILLWNFRSLLVKDIAFVGSPEASTDARVTLAIGDIDEAVIQHCEFYGLMSLVPGGSIVQSMRTHLTIRETAFLGCTANSGLYTPVVQNWEWKGIVVEDSIFADYGQRPELYGKLGYGAPICWVNVGDALPPTPDSPRREVILRRTMLDEGVWQGITVQPSRIQNPVVPIDLFYATGLFVNVSNFWQTAHYLSDVRKVLVEDGLYGWADRADSAVHVHDAEDAIIDRIVTQKSAARIRADYLTQRLTVIDSVYDDLASSAAQTVVLNPATDDDDPVLHVRTRFESALGREPDAAAHYYWSRRLLDCGSDASCLTTQRAALAAYLATNPAATFAITGRAVDDLGQTLAGVPVTLSGSQSATTTTGADGSYRFGRLPTSGSYTVTAGGKPQYTFPAPAQTVTLPAGDQTLDFNALLSRYSIGGRLTDERGRAILGATVTLSGAQTGTATTDSNGNYTLPNLAFGRNFTVAVSSARHTFNAPSQSFTNLDGDKTANFVGTSLFHTVAGRVLDTSNNPVAGVALALTGSKTDAATTDAQGNFLFADLPRGGSYAVTPGKLVGYTYNPAARNFGNLTSDAVTTIVAVPTNCKLSGRVTAAGGAGLSGVLLTLAGSKLATATTDASGAYSFDAPIHGDYAVAPSKTHYTFDRPNATFSGVASDQTADFVATVNRHRISGSVKRPAGAAMAGVTVTLSGGQAGTTTTDANGLYSFANLPAGAAYTVTPSRPGYDPAPASRSFTDLGADQSADFTVTPSNVALAGRATAAGGAALAGVTVTLAGSQSGTATTDAQGNYSFNVTSEGSYTVTAALRHYTFAPPSLTVNDPTSAQTVNFEGALNRHKLSGRVVDKNNAGLAGVAVALTGSLTVNATTDAQGYFSLTNLPAGGNYTVTASKANHSFSPGSVPAGDLGSDQTVNFTGTLLDYAVSGRVTSGGSGLTGVTVTLAGSQSGTATTDAQGNYSFTVPAEGSYTVTPALRHYTFAQGSATFANLGGSQTADFAATINRHDVSGRVADKNNAGVPGAAVTLAGSQSGTATTDAQGNYSFASLPAGGNYTVTPALAHHTFAPASRSFEDLSADAGAAFAATAVSRLISGRITEKGAPLAGVELVLAGAQAGRATTGADGSYSFTVPAGGDYTVTPAKKNYGFAPASASFGGLASDGVADFAATLQTVVGFGATSYTVTEGGAAVTFTVTREGDTSTGASVVYEGHGDTAKLGSDFVASIGLVTFAPGETTKTFTLFITDDAFVEGAELFMLTLTPFGGAVAGDAGVASVTINDNDTVASPANPIDDDQFFVREHYRDFFSREADAPGLKFWTDELGKCGADAACREARRVSVSAAFFLSIEFRETGFLVYRLYRASFGRVPVRVGEFMLDSRVVGDGVVVGGEDWEARLAANRRAFLEEWTQRPEFVQRFGGFTDWWFVQTLYDNMGVTLSEARREALLAQLSAGATRAEVLAEIIEDEQFDKQEFAPAFVLMQYFGYLRRNPGEAPDADLTGFNHWLGKLNEFGGDYEKAELVKAFLSSAEYRGRFGN